MCQPNQEDFDDFYMDDVKVLKPFDSVSQAIRDNIEKFKEEHADEIRAEMEQDVSETPTKKSNKRTRLDEFAKKPHMTYCARARMPLYANLLKPFETISKKRNQ